MRDAIRAIPDGRYRFEDVMDGDGLEAFDIPIAVEVRCDGERIRFDFAGTAPQVPGSINVTLNATVAAVGYALKALLDPEVPNNQGMLDVLEIAAEPGTLVNAVVPGRRSRRAPIPASGSSTWCSARSPRRCRSARSRRPTAPTRWRCSPAPTRAPAGRSSTSRRSAAAWAGAR